MVKCSVKGCRNGKQQTRDGSNLHRFPKDVTLRQSWLVSIGRNSNDFNPDNGSVCSLHFTETDYERDLRNELLGIRARRFLKEYAVPSINLEPADLRLSLERAQAEPTLISAFRFGQIMGRTSDNRQIDSGGSEDDPLCLPVEVLIKSEDDDDSCHNGISSKGSNVVLSQANASYMLNQPNTSVVIDQANSIVVNQANKTYVVSPVNSLVINKTSGNYRINSNVNQASITVNSSVDGTSLPLYHPTQGSKVIAQPTDSTITVPTSEFHQLVAGEEFGLLSNVQSTIDASTLGLYTAQNDSVTNQTGDSSNLVSIESIQTTPSKSVSDSATDSKSGMMTRRRTRLTVLSEPRPKILSINQQVRQVATTVNGHCNQRCVEIHKKNRELTEKLTQLAVENSSLQKRLEKLTASLHESFTEAQVQMLCQAGGKPPGSQVPRWGKEDYLRALALKTMSLRTYIYLLNDGFPLPSVADVDRWVHQDGMPEEQVISDNVQSDVVPEYLVLDDPYQMMPTKRLRRPTPRVNWS